MPVPGRAIRGLRRRFARVVREGRLVSVVVTASGSQADFLAEGLDSIRSQEHRNLQIIVVAHGADAARVLEIASGLATDDLRVEPAPEVLGDLAAARDHGVDLARGELLAFVDGSDTLPPSALGILAASLEHSRSAFAVGRTARPRSEPAALRMLFDRAVADPREGVDFGSAPWAVAGATVAGRMFRLDFWRVESLRFAGSDTQTDGTALCTPAAIACLRAEQFDVLADTVYRWLPRGRGLPFGHMRDDSRLLPSWVEQVRELEPLVRAVDAPELFDAWLVGLLETDAMTFMAGVEHMDRGTWSLFIEALRSLVGERLMRLHDLLTVETRVQVWLAVHDRRTELEELVASRWFGTGHPTVVRDGSVYARLLFFGDPDVGIPDDCYRLTDAETPLRASVRRAWWDDQGQHLELFAFIRYVDMRGISPATTAALVQTRTGARLDLDVTRFANPGVNRFAGDRDQDYTQGGLRVDIPVGELSGRVLEITCTVGAVTRTGQVEHWDRRRPTDEPPTDQPALVADTVEVPARTLLLRGHWRGSAPLGGGLEMRGDDVVVPAVLSGDQDAVTASFSTRKARWGIEPMPLPTGTYRVRGVVPSDSLARLLPEERRDDVHRSRVAWTPRGGLTVSLSAPLRDDELGAFAQHQLQEWYQTADVALDERAAYFQAYTGQDATDSPLAIYQELVRQGRDLVCYWGVADSSAWVPEGAVRVLIRSRDWYAVLARSTYLVTNINFDRWFTKRDGQRVLQTFHGYPSKTMGLTLWRSKQFTPRRIGIELARSTADWDTILTPVPEMDEHYRREYDYRGRILSVGYPRDDVLVSVQAPALREQARQRLGIADGKTVVLYAPTWRDDLATNFRKAASVDHLDLDALTAALGDDFVILMRGHRFHARLRTPSGAATVIDVSGYPEINDLILAADVALLDYSSLRFDFALTGKPMLFLVPDLGSYQGRVRGFLFDFADSAPGPLLASTDEVIAKLLDLDGVRNDYAAALASFNATYQYTQDGHASARVVEEFFGG